MKSFALLAALTLAAAPALADDKEAKPALNVDAAPQANLGALKGQRVTLTTRSGKEYDGTLAEVGGVWVRVTGLAGKEYFDALIRTDDIAAITYRVKK